MLLTHRKGFTLIELLVVVSIISLLSSVVLTSVSAAREKAAISKIVQQIRQVQTALEMYRDDNGEYPSNSGESIVVSDLVTNYLSKYITSPSFPIQQIKSFTIDDFYYNLNEYEVIRFSCEGDGEIPYTIHFASNRTDLNFKPITMSLGGEPYTTIVGSYCIASSI